MGDEEEKKKDQTTPQSDNTSTDQNQQTGGSDNPGTGNAQANTSVSDQNQQAGGDSNPGTGGIDQPTTDQNQQQGGQNNPASLKVDPSSLGSLSLGSLTDPNSGLLNQPPKLGFHIGPNGETIYDSAEEAWNHGQSISDYAKASSDSIGDVLSSYWNWANDNDQPVDIINVMGAMQGKDITKSAAQNEAEEKKTKRQQMWDSIGNVLTHLGNFAGTLAGGPAQNIESASEMTNRQQALYDATMAQRSKNNQNLLTQLWNQQANQRANELNKQKEAVEAARAAGLISDVENKKSVADANVGNINAQQHQHEAETTYTTNKDRREEEVAPLQRDKVRAQTSEANAGTLAKKASAAHSYAQARAANVATYGKTYERDRYRIWSRNRRLHPNESRDFMKQNNIHSWDRKNWTKDLIDEYNGYIADKFSSGGSRGGSASSLLD